MKFHQILNLIIYFLFNSIVLLAQNEPCTSPESSQFEFWTGEWNLEWQNEKNETITGRNTVKKILGGCVIEENFSTSDNTFIGRSFSVYNPDKKYWQQTWVDNTGGYLEFTGSFDEGKMILSRRTINKMNREIIQRMVFYDIHPDEFWWNWESSVDDGKTWKLLWKIHYMRK